MSADDPAPLVYDAPVLLLGGGPAPDALVDELHALCGAVVAADGGANRLRGRALRPDAVIGDLDSLEHAEEWRAELGPRLVHLAEQESTDFEKCLRLTRAPLYYAAGFLGGRFDHSLAALHALMRFPDRRVVLVGEEDVAFLAPLRWRARLAPGAWVSVYPIAPCVGVSSEGLVWPLRNLALAAGEAIGTSNRAAAADVAVTLDRRAAAVMVERRFLAEAVASLGGDG